MKTLFKISIICCLFIAASCDETKKVIDTASQVQLTGDYTVNMVNNNKIDNNITIAFNPLNKQINGDAGCNSYFGSYNVSNFELTFSGVGSTKKLCQPASIMKSEQEFLSALDNVGSYRLNNNVLTLYSKIDNAIVISANKKE